VVSLDQLTKHYVVSLFSLGAIKNVIPGFFNLTHIRNNGFAFGMLKEAPTSLQDLFFIGIPVFALILIILIFIKLRDNQMLTSIALTTILGGATGNLIDRLQYGYVIDIMDFHIGEKIHIPAFNIADCSIIVGVSIMFIHTLLYSPEGEA
jgi:signal peptidase II